MSGMARGSVERRAGPAQLIRWCLEFSRRLHLVLIADAAAGRLAVVQSTPPQIIRHRFAPEVHTVLQVPTLFLHLQTRLTYEIKHNPLCQVSALINKLVASLSP